VKLKHGPLIAALIAAALWPAASTADAPNERAATCADYPNQAAAQRAADTRDADADGIFCETLPCPCSSAEGGDETPEQPDPKQGCVRPDGVQRLVFSASEYPNVRAHFRAAVDKGWPRRLVLNRPGADERRERLLRDVPTRDGHDRDEYPPAVGRGKGKGLTRGRDPRGWTADVRHVPSSENRSHGATLGIKLREFCDGTRFRYAFR